MSRIGTEPSLVILSVDDCGCAVERGVTQKPAGQALFEAHIGLLRQFLAHREEIVERIEALLNAQRKPAPHLQTRLLPALRFEDCFFEHTAIGGREALKGQLEEAYRAAGFTPREVHHVYNDLTHPVELMVRGLHCWQQTRWPGRSGRQHYAHTLFNLYLLRCLALVSLRIWDEDPGRAGESLVEIQGVLDQLRKSSPPDQPAFVRDARWLVPLAQSLITDELTPYLEVARLVAGTLPKEDALEIQRAQVRMLGAHLTSQIRHYSTRDGVPIGDPSIVVRTRTSNALDFALLIQGLVELLHAYERALASGDERMRLDMAGAICQGISADPELFVNRIELLSAYSMMEDVLIARDGEGTPGYSPLGERHVRLVKEYGALMERLTAPLRDDVPRFRPVDGRFSPCGVVFGIPSNLVEHMALKTLEHDAETRFSLEDVFDDRDHSAAKLAWVNGWRKLPHIDPEVQRLYAYPQQFAEEIYERVESELRRDSVPAIGHLYIATADDKADAPIPELPAKYLLSTDAQSLAQLLRDRQEAHFLVSYKTAGGWIALRKDLLTEVLGAGRDAGIGGLPVEAAQVLQLMCGDLVKTLR